MIVGSGVPEGLGVNIGVGVKVGEVEGIGVVALNDWAILPKD